MRHRTPPGTQADKVFFLPSFLPPLLLAFLSSLFLLLLPVFLLKVSFTSLLLVVLER